MACACSRILTCNGSLSDNTTSVSDYLLLELAPPKRMLPTVSTWSSSGNNVILQCRTNSTTQELNWYYGPLKEVLYSGGIVNASFGPRFRVVGKFGQMLVISAVQFNDSGRYSCEDATHTLLETYVSIFDTLLHLTFNAPSTSYEGDRLTVSCEVEYTGYKPVLQLTKNKQLLTNQEDKSTAGISRVSSDIILSSTNETFGCHLNDSPLLLSVKIRGPDVLYCPRNCTLSSRTCQPQLTCSANSNPSSDYLWKDVFSTDVVSNGFELDNPQAEHLYECTARSKSNKDGTYCSCSVVIACGAHVQSTVNIARGRPTMQSSRFVDRFNRDPANAVDGNRDSDVAHGSCTSTTPSDVTNTWWSVDLGSVKYIDMVVVSIETKCSTCTDGPFAGTYTVALRNMENFLVGVTNVSPSTIPPRRGQYMCGQYPGTANTDTVNVTCRPDTPPGRYVTIQPSKFTYLSLCEIEVYANDLQLKLTSNATSSVVQGEPISLTCEVTFSGSKPALQLMVDGGPLVNEQDTSKTAVGISRVYGEVLSHYGDKYYCHVKDMSHVSPVTTQVNVLYCPRNCKLSSKICGQTLTCSVDSNPESEIIWRDVTDNAAVVATGFELSTQLPGHVYECTASNNSTRNKALCSCSASIACSAYIQSTRNVAHGRNTFQSSLIIDRFNRNPANAVDGNRNSDVANGSCTSTVPLDLSEPNPWWAVDLGHVTFVDMVVVTIQTMCSTCTGGAGKLYSRHLQNMNNFIVGLTNENPSTNPPQRGSYSVCAQYPGTPVSATVNVSCGPDTHPGRYLVIQLPQSHYISICEVEVYANDMLLNVVSNASSKSSPGDLVLISCDVTYGSSRPQLELTVNGKPILYQYDTSRSRVGISAVSGRHVVERDDTTIGCQVNDLPDFVPKVIDLGYKSEDVTDEQNVLTDKRVGSSDTTVMKYMLYAGVPVSLLVVAGLLACCLLIAGRKYKRNKQLQTNIQCISPLDDTIKMPPT